MKSIQLTWMLILISSSVLFSQQKTYTIKSELTSFILVPFFEDWDKSMKKEECSYPRIELEIKDRNKSYDWEKVYLNGKGSTINNGDTVVIPVKMDGSLGLKSLINKFYKEYNFSENGGEAPVQFKDKEGRIYELKDEYVGKMFEFKIKESLCDDYPVKEGFFELFSVKLIQEKSKQNKILETKNNTNMKGDDSLDIFPVPFVAKSSNLGISRDSLHKFILNTTGLYYPYPNDYSQVAGKGDLLSTNPNYIFHKSTGMYVREYEDSNCSIVTYFPTVFNLERDKNGNEVFIPIKNNKKFATGKELDSDGTFDAINTSGNVHPCPISDEHIRMYVTSTNLIGDTSLFTKNALTKKQEHEVYFRLINNSLFGIETKLNIGPFWTDTNDYKGSSKSVAHYGYNYSGHYYRGIPKKGVNLFIKYFDKYLGKSKLYISFRDSRSNLRVWKKGNCLLLVHIDINYGISSIEYYDELLCDNYVKQLRLNQPEKYISEKYIPMETIYGQELAHIKRGYYKLVK